MLKLALYFLLIIFGITHVYSKGRNVVTLFGDSLCPYSFFMARYIYTTLKDNDRAKGEKDYYFFFVVQILYSEVPFFLIQFKTSIFWRRKGALQLF